MPYTVPNMYMRTVNSTYRSWPSNPSNLLASAGNFSASGQDVIVSPQRRLINSVGSIIQTGQSAVLNYSGTSTPVLLFSTNFNSDTIGAQPAGGNGVTFGGHKGSVNVSVQTGPNGTKGLRFSYFGGPTGTQNNAQFSFDFGAGYREVVIEFDLYVPANYNHRGTSSNNHKLFRLFPATSDDFGYGSVEKVGASLWNNTSGDGGSRVNNEFNMGGGMGEYFSLGNSSVNGFIAPSDFGGMMTVKLRNVAPTATTNAILEIYKNGIPFDSFSPDNYSDGQPHNYQRGYLLGAPNGGFAEDTYLYIDELKFYGVV